ncbi:protoporphyrinogen oxidase [Lysinibacillus sp. SGAir0095]|uniref:protoporphyrinogen oxidase n=1 Tax=Lysinibacillus sp. SGAir0095 TaxID=2070463 RepID=UPI0010CD198F|nr:protoporphyrinogen oxidase [Lysinibacillus sp. SGAir0095]QCR33925.1 protoporphyrinogen oxidase [Lysinibacillus sp. SGAir0095]
MKTVVVVGGGITGLCTLHYLKRQAPSDEPIRFILAEKNEYLGGKMHTMHESGFIMETGADSIVARHPNVLELVKELKFESELVYNETGISYIHTNNELHAIPAGSTFGIPMSMESLLASTLISHEGKQRVLMDAEIPNDRFTKESSIGDFLEFFLGKEIVEKQIAPVLAGVYSGDLYQLSLASTLPYLVDYKNKYGSIMKGFEANKEQFEKAANKKFISFKNGLSSLINRLEELLPEVEYYKNTETTSVKKTGTLYEVSFSNGEIVQADVVVLAVPNNVVRSVLNDEEMDANLSKFTNASALTIYLGFDLPDSILPADGTGFIVSHNSDLVCNASTWTSRKWKHTSEDGNLLVRLFYKNTNPRYEELAAMSDEELTRVALEDVKLSLNIEEIPIVVNLAKWIEKMPKYDLAHKEALDSLLVDLDSNYPNLYIAGCSYFGVGIGACIENGKHTADKVLGSLASIQK